MDENSMRQIRIHSVTINIGCGEGGEKLDNAKKLLERITHKRVAITYTRKRTTFGMAKGRAIGCKVTLRGKDALTFLKAAFDAIDFKLEKSCFDRQGNFSFGLRSYIDLPNVKYDPAIGMYGADICVSLERPGFRVKRKRIPYKIGKSHCISPEEAIAWVGKTFNVSIE